MRNLIVLCILVLSIHLYSKTDTVKEFEEQINQNNRTTSGSSYLETKETHANTAEAKALIKKAFKYIDLHGEEKAFSEFNNPKSEFFYKDLYIFVIDMKGNIFAHGGETQLVNTNQLKLKDSVGKYFIQDFIANLKTKDTAIVEYYWMNYETLEIESKLSYLEKYSNDRFLGCGIYYGIK